MKRSPIRSKPKTAAQLQLKEEYRKYKADLRAIGQAGKSRSGARGSLYKGEYIPSQWQKECLQLLELREKVGEITDLESQPIIPFTIYNEAGQPYELKIEVDFAFFDKNLNRHCRWDAKPPKVVHTKHGRRYPQKLHAEWMLRFKLLQHCQPDFDYRLLEKGNTWADYDLNITED